jgi:hypothetical protein
MSKMTVSEYAKHRGLSKTIIYEYLKEGTISKTCVINQKPLELDAELADACLEASTASGKTADEGSLLFQKIRLTRINADRKQMELERARGELIETDKAMKQWGVVLTNFIRGLESLSRKLPPLVYGLEPAEVQAVVAKMVHDIRDELSNPDLLEVALQAQQQKQAQAPPPAKKSKKK